MKQTHVEPKHQTVHPGDMTPADVRQRTRTRNKLLLLVLAVMVVALCASAFWVRINYIQGHAG